ncbi:MAG: tRNA (guanosine(37)-N1)-methyltransferase TrmD [Planctomycetota bacterium]|jgi:tRNA (guanine37-N1)-methyltransferase
MLIDIVTIFPDMFRPVLETSILRIAREKGALDVRVADLREFTDDRHRSVDDRPFGGGPGMIIKVAPVVRAVRKLEEEGPAPVRILMTPQGERFSQGLAEELAREERLLLVAGHYEGYDERIRTILEPREISIGDYVLTGGELPAMVVVDAVVRLLPGVLGAEDATEFESFSPGSGGALEYPHYTRPQEFEGQSVPEVLVSGDHARVEGWRRAQAAKRTRRRRPDLLDKDRPAKGE